MTIWKDLVGYENKYLISNTGRIISKKIDSKRKDGRSYKRVEKELTPWKNSKGYFVVQINTQPKINKLVHRLVAETFIPNIDNKPFIDHIDGNPSNNNITNLRWCTQKENMNNIISVKRCSKAKLGKKPVNTKKVIQLSLDGEYINIFDSICDASRKTGSNDTNIRFVCQGKRKMCGGFKWKYGE